MITILAWTFLIASAFCSLLLWAACAVGGNADDRAPQPPPAESWEQSRARYEEQHGKRMRKYYT